MLKCKPSGSAPSLPKASPPVPGQPLQQKDTEHPGKAGISPATEDNKKGTTPAAPNQCSHVKGDQCRCRANARHNSPFCFFHDPESAVDSEAARTKGGRERSRRAAVLPPDTPNRPLTSAADVTELLGETINQVRRGEIEARIANAVGYLAGVLLNATGKGELEQRLARLESILARQSEDPESGFDLNSHPERVEFVNPESDGQA